MVRRYSQAARAVLLAVLAVPSHGAARPAPSTAPAGAAAACGAAIEQAERAGNLPPRLLASIAIVESGRRDPASGAVTAWPWTINAEGTGHFYDTKAEAVAAAQAFQAAGIHSIDVGCAQVNLQYHPDAFTSLEQAFDPVFNAAYAARFLNSLFAQTATWPQAAAAYHSFTRDLGADYARKVLAIWGMPEAAAMPPATQPAPSPALGPAPGPAPGGRVAVMLPVGLGAIQVLPVTSAAALPAARIVQAQTVGSQKVALR